MAMQKGYIRTFNGQRIYPAGDHALNGTREKIKVIDLAHHLSQINRYTGASRFPYSVGLHSLACHTLAKRRGYGLTTVMGLTVHDGSEAYLADLAAPVKDLPEFEPYRKFEDALQREVFAKFLGRQPDVEEQKKIVEIDRDIFCAEWPVLMGEPEPGIPAPKQDAVEEVQRWIEWDHAQVGRFPTHVRDRFNSALWGLAAMLGLGDASW